MVHGTPARASATNTNIQFVLIVDQIAVADAAVTSAVVTVGGEILNVVRYVHHVLHFAQSILSPCLLQPHVSICRCAECTGAESDLLFNLARLREGGEGGKIWVFFNDDAFLDFFVRNPMPSAAIVMDAFISVNSSVMFEELGDVDLNHFFTDLVNDFDDEAFEEPGLGELHVDVLSNICNLEGVFGRLVGRGGVR